MESDSAPAAPEPPIYLLLGDCSSSPFLTYQNSVFGSSHSGNFFPFRLTRLAVSLTALGDFLRISEPLGLCKRFDIFSREFPEVAIF
jgi:hypothetical protein